MILNMGKYIDKTIALLHCLNDSLLLACAAEAPAPSGAGFFLEAIWFA